mgnify:CR=1 FL=1
MLKNKRKKYKPKEKNEQKLKKYINGKSESNRLSGTRSNTSE